jgi:hypothetical protein
VWHGGQGGPGRRRGQGGLCLVRRTIPG